MRASASFVAISMIVLRCTVAERTLSSILVDYPEDKESWARAMGETPSGPWIRTQAAQTSPSCIPWRRQASIDGQHTDKETNLDTAEVDGAMTKAQQLLLDFRNVSDQAVLFMMQLQTALQSLLAEMDDGNTVASPPIESILTEMASGFPRPVQSPTPAVSGPRNNRHTIWSTITGSDGSLETLNVIPITAGTGLISYSFIPESTYSGQGDLPTTMKTGLFQFPRITPPSEAGNTRPRFTTTARSTITRYATVTVTWSSSRFMAPSYGHRSLRTTRPTLSWTGSRPSFLKTSMGGGQGSETITYASAGVRPVEPFLSTQTKKETATATETAPSFVSHNHGTLTLLRSTDSLWGMTIPKGSPPSPKTEATAPPSRTSTAAADAADPLAVSASSSHFISSTAVVASAILTLVQSLTRGSSAVQLSTKFSARMVVTGRSRPLSGTIQGSSLAASSDMTNMLNRFSDSVTHNIYSSKTSRNSNFVAVTSVSSHRPIASNANSINAATASRSIMVLAPIPAVTSTSSTAPSTATNVSNGDMSSSGIPPASVIHSRSSTATNTTPPATTPCATATPSTASSSVYHGKPTRSETASPTAPKNAI